MKYTEAMELAEQIINYVEMAAMETAMDKDAGVFYATCYGHMKGLLPGLLADEMQNATLKSIGVKK